MKNLKKIVFIILVGVLLLAPMTCYAQSNLKITGTNVYSTGSGNRSVTKYSTNKGIGFCITPNKNGPKKGDSLKYVSTINDGGLRYILDNVSSSSKSSVVTSQLGLWRYYNDYKRPASSSYTSSAKNIANKAKNNSGYNTTPSISMSPSSLQLNEGNNYYLSDYITVKGSNLTTNITVALNGAPEGAYIADENGNKKTSFKSGDKFYILIPKEKVTASTSFKVVASSSGKVSRIEKYKKNSNTQEIIILVKENKNVSAESKLSVKPVIRKCEIYNDKYYDKDGNETTQEIYSEQCEEKVVRKCEIFEGKYYDKDGNETTQEIYSDQCEEHEDIIVPDTADNNGLLYIILGGGLFGFVFGTLKSIRNRKEFI